MAKIKIENLTQGAYDYKYIVFRIVEGKNWYWGAFDNVLRASEACAELGSNARIVETAHLI